MVDHRPPTGRPHPGGSRRSARKKTLDVRQAPDKIWTMGEMKLSEVLATFKAKERFRRKSDGVLGFVVNIAGDGSSYDRVSFVGLAGPVCHYSMGAFLEQFEKMANAEYLLAMVGDYYEVRFKIGARHVKMSLEQHSRNRGGLSRRQAETIAQELANRGAAAGAQEASER